MNQKKQLSILEFSRLTGISRDNLRFYDRIGLLCPEQRGENNYRYYARSQLNSAYLISSLRLLEVGLEDIRRYSAGRTPERMLAFFAQQEERIQAEIARLRERLVRSDMDALLFDACLEAMASLAADKLAEAVADDAHERGLHRGSTLETGVEDFPLTMNTTLAFFTQTEKRLGLTAAEDGTPSDRWSTWGVIGLYNETQKKRRGCAYCHNVRTCTIRKIGMTCHGRRTRKKAKSTSVQ